MSERTPVTLMPEQLEELRPSVERVVARYLTGASVPVGADPLTDVIVMTTWDGDIRFLTPEAARETLLAVGLERAADYVTRPRSEPFAIPLVVVVGASATGDQLLAITTQVAAHLPAAGGAA